jgi:pimeloyl-ACP methyl ester carboxylesterase
VLAVLDTLGVDRVLVAGFSMGGYVAFPLLDLLGARLSGLLLADTRPTADTEDAARRRHELAAEVEASGVDVAAAELIPKLLGPTSQRERPELIDHLNAMVRENTPVGVAAALRAMAARPDATARLARIRCPVVCVVGEEDTLTPPDVARAMAEGIPGARLSTIPLAGHLTNLEAPDAFNDVLLELLAESTPA